MKCFLAHMGLTLDRHFTTIVAGLDMAKIASVDQLVTVNKVCRAGPSGPRYHPGNQPGTRHLPTQEVVYSVGYLLIYSIFPYLSTDPA